MRRRTERVPGERPRLRLYRRGGEKSPLAAGAIAAGAIPRRAGRPSLTRASLGRDFAPNERNSRAQRIDRGKIQFPPARFQDRAQTPKRGVWPIAGRRGRARPLRVPSPPRPHPRSRPSAARPMIRSADAGMRENCSIDHGRAPAVVVGFSSHRNRRRQHPAGDFRAMCRALAALVARPAYVVIDGNDLPRGSAATARRSSRATARSSRSPPPRSSPGLPRRADAAPLRGESRRWLQPTSAMRRRRDSPRSRRMGRLTTGRASARPPGRG